MGELIALVPTEFVPDLDHVVGYDGTSVLPDLDRVGFFVPSYLGEKQNISWTARMPNLQVIQLLTAGFESAFVHVPRGVLLCNARGVHDSSTAELAVGLMIARLRRLDDMARAMQTGTWVHPVRGTALADRRVLIVGAGGIARAMQRRLEAHEAEVTLVGRTARGSVHGADELPDLLSQADIVALAVPLDESTAGMVDAAFLARMRDGAMLVNVSRGGIVRTEDLLAELTNGRLHAALDVTDPEPLPVDHPLWHAPNLLISGHVGGDTTAFPPRARRLVEGQVRRWLSGADLEHVVHVGGAQ